MLAFLVAIAAAGLIVEHYHPVVDEPPSPRHHDTGPDFDPALGRHDRHHTPRVEPLVVGQDS